MKLKTQNYLQQRENWPAEGKHIMAQYSEETVVVYQAYRPSIGHYASKNNHFGGEFSYSRMSWIKPNFLWMMYRCGWALKEGQEVVLAIHLKRDFFENILLNAFPSTNNAGLSKQEWNQKVAQTNVRLQWDPDHAPNGNKEIRRAIQLGLRGEYLTPFKGEGIRFIEDITEFVKEQYEHVKNGNLSELITPEEFVFPTTKSMAINLGMVVTD